MTSNDLKWQIVQKIAKRSCKIEKVASSSELLKMVRNELLVVCLQNVESAKLSILQKVDLFAKNVSKYAKIDLIKIKRENVIHKTELLTTKLQNLNDQANSPSRFGNNSSITKTPHCSSRFQARQFEDEQFVDFQFDIDQNESSMFYYDIEDFVKQNNNSLDSMEIKDLYTLMEIYIQKASAFYANDQLGYSRMVVTCIKIGIEILDIFSKFNFGHTKVKLAHFLPKNMPKRTF